MTEVGLTVMVLEGRVEDPWAG